MVTKWYRNDLMKIPKAAQPFIKHGLKNESEQNKLNFNGVLTLSDKMFCSHTSAVKVGSLMLFYILFLL